MENKMMVMRRALRDVSRVAEEMTRGTMTGESVDRKTVDAWAMRLCEIVSQDLAIPLRQCDVGTPEEQAERFHAFCDGHSSGIGGMCDGNCPCFGCVDGCHCLCKWAHMPYEAEEGAEK